jgi:hypothetical protein
MARGLRQAEEPAERRYQGRSATVVDRENPNRIDIQWDDVKTVDERMAEAEKARILAG